MSDAIVSKGFLLEIGDVGDSPTQLTEIKEIKSFAAFEGSAAEIDVTHLQSDAKEYIMGLQDFGGFNVDVNHLSGDVGQDEARAAKVAGTKKTFLATWADGETASFDGFVLGNPRNGGVDAVVDGSFSIKITGLVTFA